MMKPGLQKVVEMRENKFAERTRNAPKDRAFQTTSGNVEMQAGN